ncbi:MAG: hypothetical protein JWO67_4535 [Streptosporangiaceae bacterium]|nr:hypothetical protein [Streptosporangiaceae bacterium]
MSDLNPRILAEAIAEMKRKPDASMCLDLIDNLTDDTNVQAILNAYYEALEDR